MNQFARPIVIKKLAQFTLNAYAVMVSHIPEVVSSHYIQLFYTLLCFVRSCYVSCYIFSMIDPENSF